MYIQDYMTTNVVTIHPNTSIIKARELLRAHNINRLPVMDNKDLVGLITSEIIERYSPSGVSSLDRHEVNYLLQKTKVQDIMNKKVPTVTPGTLLDEAAARMSQDNIGALVVLENERLEGIITDKDIFKAFIDISGYYSAGSSLVLELAEDRQGVIEEIGDSLVETDHNLTHMMVYHLMGAIRIVMHVESEEVDNLCESLQSKGYEVKTVQNK